MFASPAVHTRRCALAAQLRKLHLGIGQIFSRDMTVQCDAQHPCWKAAHFLPCTRPPDVMRLHRSSNRATYGPSERRAYALTRSGFQTMPRRDEDAVTEVAASATARGARAPRFGTRAQAPMTPPAPDRPDTPDDLRTALGTPDSFGVKLFEINVLQSILKSCPDVKDAVTFSSLGKFSWKNLAPLTCGSSTCLSSTGSLCLTMTRR